MIYLIEGADYYLINNEIKKIISHHNINDDEVEYYDSKVNLNYVMQSAFSFSFFSQLKLIVYTNPNFLSTMEQTNFLEQYIENQNEFTILVLVADKLDNRKKIVKLLKKQAKYIMVEPLTNKNKRSFILNQIKMNNLKIKRECLELFIKKMPLNAGIICSEVEKLKLINTINLEIIEELISEYFDDSTFEFVDIILEGYLSKTLQYFARLKKRQSVMQIIGALASKIRLIYQVSILDKHYNEFEIVEILKSKPYPVKLAFQYIYKKDSLYYLKLLNDLNELSYKIRHGLIEANLGFDLFLIRKGVYEINNTII